MSLSICCITANPGGAAAVLRIVREVADEIVVAVDVSGGELDLTGLAGVADRLFEIELDGFVEPALAWVHAQCSADWILRIDDDEVVSASLLEQLPELTRARDVVQYYLARRWLHPDRIGWLNAWPWFPDFQGRLVRNDAQLWFPGLCHTSFAFVMPARYLDSGLYHLVCPLSDRQERERKVERYLAIDPALRSRETDRVLSIYYLPERHPQLRVAAVDPSDVSAVDGVLTQPREPLRPRRRGPVPWVRARARTRRTQRVTRREVCARWAERDLDPAAHRASISPVDVYRQLVVDDHRPFRIRVRNEGTEWWPGGEDRRPLIRVAYHWLTPDGTALEQEGARTPLPHPLAPGESCLVAMKMTAPPVPGRYLLAPDLVHEFVTWFHCDLPPVEMRVTAPDPEPR